MTSKNPNLVVQRGRPLDPCPAIRRAHQQPRTDVTDTTRGEPQQPRTGVLHANRGKETIAKKSSFNICTYNTRTINDLHDDALDVMLQELSNVNWDVIGLSETKMKESKIQQLEESGDRLYFSGNEVSRSHGVGFLVKKELLQVVEDYDPISDRLATLSLQGKFSKIVIVQCYFPTSQYPDQDVIDLYDQIQEIIDRTPKRDHLIVMGDFNSKVGGLHTTYPSAIGKHTSGNYNSRGEILAKFCTQNNLVATNTLFKKRKHYTWTSPDGKTKNQIDFILTRPSRRQVIIDSSVLSVPDISDHRMVRTHIKLKFIWPKKQPRQRKYDIDQLQKTNISKSFQLLLSNRFNALSTEPDDDVNVLSTEITSAITDSIAHVLPTKDQSHPGWMTNETKQAILNKHQTRRKYGGTSIKYKVAKAETKKLVRKDKMKHIEQEIDLVSTLPPHKQYYAAIKKLKSKPKNVSWGIKNKDGTILTNKTEILEQWATFYEELYSDNSSSVPVNDSSDEKLPHILKSEIRTNIKELKTGKSPGLDNIYSEYVKAGGEPLVNALHVLFNHILKTNNVPSSFKEALIVVIFKKDSRLECKNYRPISLLSHIYKLFISIIAARVKNDLYTSFPPSQAAYQPGRGTIEQIIALEQIIEKSIEFNNPVYIVFIDFTKAFDSIKLPSLWRLLEKTSINKRYIKLLQSTYSDSNAAIKTDIGISRFVNILKGVKQGDILSALLFCIIVASIILKTEEECNTGFSIGGQLLSNLSYADDIAAINNNHVKLQLFIDSLAKHAAEVGLFINIAKTKCMTTAKSNKILNLTIYNKQIKQVNDFIYLGHKLSSTNNGAAAVQHRIGLGWASFSKYKLLLTSPRIPYHIKNKIYNTYILPVVLYGLECVNWTKTQCNKIEVFQNHIMRFMTNHKLTDHITIETLRKTTKLIPIMAVIKSRTLKLFGHIKRCKVGYSKLCLEGMVTGKRSRGAQPTRWRNNIYKWANLDLKSLNLSAQDRDHWKIISHVSAHSAASGDSDI